LGLRLIAVATPSSVTATVHAAALHGAFHGARIGVGKNHGGAAAGTSVLLARAISPRGCVIYRSRGKQSQKAHYEDWPSACHECLLSSDRAARRRQLLGFQTYSAALSFFSAFSKGERMNRIT